MNNCGKCAQPLADGVKFCTECGASVLASVPESNSDENHLLSRSIDRSELNPPIDAITNSHEPAAFDDRFGDAEPKRRGIKAAIAIVLCGALIVISALFWLRTKGSLLESGDGSRTVVMPPKVTGEIVQVWPYSPNGAVIARQGFDQVLVFAQLRLHNETKQSLFMQNIVVNATMEDGIHHSKAGPTADYDQVFVAFPDMTVPKGNALSPQSTIDPGQTIEGAIVTSFRVTRERWNARKDLSISVDFRDEPSLVLMAQPSAKPANCGVPSLLSKSHFQPPPRPTGINLDNFRRTVENDPTIPSEAKEQWKQEAIQADLKNDAAASAPVEIDTFDPDTAIGGQMNQLLVEMNQARSEFLSLNGLAENQYKGAYYASAGSKATDVLRSEKLNENGQDASAKAVSAKVELKDLAETFASSWQGLDDCNKRQFSNKTIWPLLPNYKEPDVFVEIDSDGGLRTVMVHNPDHGALPIRIYPWEW